MTQLFPTIVTSRRLVPNTFPSIDPGDFRLAVIGEAPGETEESYGIPFVGKSGDLLFRAFQNLGVSRTQLFIGNVCQVRPPGNRITAFSWKGSEIQDGIAQLTQDLTTFNPNICFLLGNTPLHLAKDNQPLRSKKKDSDDESTYPFKISSWRGSLFKGSIPSPLLARKCIPTLHPAGVLREFTGHPLLTFDIHRAVGEAKSPDLTLPQRVLEINLSTNEILHRLRSWPAGQSCSLDIEGGLPNDCVNDGVRADSKRRRYIGWRCVSLASSPLNGFTIVWKRHSLDDQIRIMREFAGLMYRIDVPKILQNSLYDNFVLSFGYSIPIRNVVEDTMLKGWEIYSELPKGLSTQASIWTREPHWKDESMYQSDGDGLAAGCAIDSSVTLEISIAQEGALDQLGRSHYRANISALAPLLYMELRGIKYDTEHVKIELAETTGEIQGLGESLSKIAGTELRGAKGSLSSQRLAKALYETKGYPPQFKKEGGRKTDKLTTDVEALLSLRKKLPGDDFLNGILRHRHLEGLIETLGIVPDSDGRVRCGYNIVGTETGRLTCYTSPTGAGANLQTITKKLRKNYVADPGYDFFQCDLAGADGWTVAAHCLKLNDPTMFEDYLGGLKPARILALLYELGPAINLLDRPDLKNACRAVDNDGWLYFASKRVQHGTNYLMGIPTMQSQVMKDSFKLSGEPIYMEHASGKHLQEMYFSRYPGVRTWHNYSQSVLVSKGELTSASGHTRKFFGRRFGNEIHDTLKEFLADEPQQNTTWATNLAMMKLWNDPENRRGGKVLEAYDTWRAGLTKAPGSLIIEPLHTVHDALCGQWPRDCRDWARGKVRSWFNNELTIAGTKLVIPFDGGYGPSWGECTNPL